MKCEYINCFVLFYIIYLTFVVTVIITMPALQEDQEPPLFEFLKDSASLNMGLLSNYSAAVPLRNSRPCVCLLTWPRLL